MADDKHFPNCVLQILPALKEDYRENRKFLIKEWERFFDLENLLDFARNESLGSFKFYIKLHLRYLAEKKECNNYIDIFDDRLLDKGAPRLIILVGPAGSGKTNLLHKIAYDWAIECDDKNSGNIGCSDRRSLKWLQERFKLVLFLKLGNLSSDTTLAAAINQVHPAIDGTIIAEVLQQDCFIQEKTLILLDAYDEFLCRDSCGEINALALGKGMLGEATVIVSTRPHMVTELVAQPDTVRLVAIEGLDQEGMLAAAKHHTCMRSMLSSAGPQVIELLKNPLLFFMAANVLNKETSMEAPHRLELFDVVDTFVKHKVERFQQKSYGERGLPARDVEDLIRLVGLIACSRRRWPEDHDEGRDDTTLDIIQKALWIFGHKEKKPSQLDIIEKNMEQLGDKVRIKRLLRMVEGCCIGFFKGPTPLIELSTPNDWFQFAPQWQFQHELLAEYFLAKLAAISEQGELFTMQSTMRQFTPEQQYFLSVLCPDILQKPDFWITQANLHTAKLNIRWIGYPLSYTPGCKIKDRLEVLAKNKVDKLEISAAAGTEGFALQLAGRILNCNINPCQFLTKLWLYKLKSPDIEFEPVQNDGTGGNAEFVLWLDSCIHLEELVLLGPSVGSPSLGANVFRVKKLYFDHCSFTNNFFPSVEDNEGLLPNVEELVCRHCKLDDVYRFFNFLSRAQLLRHIEFIFFDLPDDANDELSHRLKQLPNLTTLRIFVRPAIKLVFDDSGVSWQSLEQLTCFDVNPERVFADYEEADRTRPRPTGQVDISIGCAQDDNSTSRRLLLNFIACSIGVSQLTVQYYRNAILDEEILDGLLKVAGQHPCLRRLIIKQHGSISLNFDELSKLSNSLVELAGPEWQLQHCTDDTLLLVKEE